MNYFGYMVSYEDEDHISSASGFGNAIYNSCKLNFLSGETFTGYLNYSVGYRHLRTNYEPLSNNLTKEITRTLNTVHFGIGPGFNLPVAKKILLGIQYQLQPNVCLYLRQEQKKASFNLWRHTVGLSIGKNPWVLQPKISFGNYRMTEHLFDWLKSSDLKFKANYVGIGIGYNL
jgi:hypothetical protein